MRRVMFLIGHVAGFVLLEYALVARDYPGVESIAKHILRHFLLIAAMDGVILAIFAMVHVLERHIGSTRGLAQHIAAMLFGIQAAGLLFLYVGGHYSLPVLGRLADGDLAYLMVSEGLTRVQNWGGMLALGGAAVLAIVLLGVMFGFGRLLTKGMPSLSSGISTREMTAMLLGGLYATALFLAVRTVAHPETGYDDPLATATLGVLANPNDMVSIRNASGSNTQNLEEQLSFRTVPQAASDAKNIVIIVSDSLRADHLPLYGYDRMTTPFLSRLGKDGHLHKAEIATSTCSESVCGIFSILGSKLIAHAGGKTNFMLHQALKDRGYRVNFILSGAHTTYHPLPELYGPQSQFDNYIDGDLSGRGLDDRSVLNYLSAMPASQGEPNLFFIFLMSSHVIGRQFAEHPPFLPTPDTFDPYDLFLNGGRHSLTPDEKQRNINRYDNGIAQADGVIESIFGILQAKGYMSNTVTFITADHGDALGERGLYAHTKYIYPEFVRVPLLIFDPSDTKYENLAFADQTDIAVTALDRLGLPKPASWEGRSLVGGKPRNVAFTQNDHIGEIPCRGIYLRRSESLNYMIRCEREGGAASEEVFDLTADPSGLKSAVETTPPSDLDEMRARLRKTFKIHKNQL